MPHSQPVAPGIGSQTLDFSDLVELARFSEATPAVRLRALLQEAGIRAVPLDFDPQSGEDVYRVLVSPADLARAEACIAEASGRETPAPAPGS